VGGCERSLWLRERGERVQATQDRVLRQRVKTDGDRLTLDRVTACMHADVV
jgi:hypothetical protein